MDNLLYSYHDYLTAVGTDIAQKLDTGSLNNNNISWNQWLKKYNYENSPYTKFNYAVKIANNLQYGGKTKKNTKKPHNKLVKNRNNKNNSKKRIVKKKNKSKNTSKKQTKKK